MRLEEPKLGLKFHRISISKWMSEGCRKGDKVLSMALIGSKDGIFCPDQTNLHSWSYLDKNQYLVDMPSNFYNFIFLTNVIEYYNIEYARKLIKECKRMVKKGGIIASCSRACNDGQEIYDIVKHKSNIDISKFVNNRLSDNEIILLKPDDAAFFPSKTIAPNRRRLVQIMKSMGIEDANLEMGLWGVKEKVAIRKLQVGLKWVRT